MKIKSKKESPPRNKAEKGEPRLYEAMFLVDSAEATSDWEGVNAAIQKMLEKAGVEIVSMRKWDDRRLAYDINGKEKGTYVLCYFKAEGNKIRGIERDVQLSERIMRVLILSAERHGIQDSKASRSREKEEAEPREDAATEQIDEDEQEYDAELEADDLLQ